MYAITSSPERYRPAVDHFVPPSHLSKPTQPVTMYTLDARHLPYEEELYERRPVTQPVLFSIPGNSRPVDMYTPIPTTTTDLEKEPIVYRIVGHPSSQNIYDETTTAGNRGTEEVQDTQPVFYSIVGRPSTKDLPTTARSIEPTLYTITGHPTSQNIAYEDVPVINDKRYPSPVLYNLSDSPEPNGSGARSKITMEPSRTPKFYSITGEQYVEKHYLQKENVDPYMYNIVGQPKLLETYITYPTQEDIRMYTIKGTEQKPSLLRSPNTVPSTRKNQQPLNESNIPIIEKSPTLYSIVGQPDRPALRQPKERARSIPKVVSPPLRRNCSLDSKSSCKDHHPVHHFQPIHEPDEIISDSTGDRHTMNDSVRVPENISIPLEKKQRGRKPAVENILIRKHQEPQTFYEPKPMERSRTPYEYRTQKPWQAREQNYVIKRWPEESQPPRVTQNPTLRTNHGYMRPTKTIERLPIDTRRRWDYIDGTQDDNGDIRRKRSCYEGKTRRRAPWIPVWT
ncbi:unnamed protein product [Didymodactylos carnosus]|uniref:Uncharacterized protein n=1 Tax=Didymodactylos carnosus TaxID=1234261 RepID=A0A814QRK2_9BILA|nr:unnamed protein product [Didymodactylos carnosus]CAF1123466.1 unnamed protein product [Didymodactylos carnosus]CAF3815215.1 unnamed protein product [Didymodactylos carnosus]CAF3887029.1 unnamed protein product [Didymodactylos carnosus]